MYDGCKGTILTLVREAGTAMATVAFLEEMGPAGSIPAGNQTFFPRDLTYVPVVEAEASLLDAFDHPLLPGDMVKIVPDVSKSLSGRLATLVGNYDAAAHSVEITLLDEPKETKRILPYYLEWVETPGAATPEKDGAAAVTKPEALTSVLVATQAPATDVQRAGRRQEPVAPLVVPGQAAYLAASNVVSAGRRQAADPTAPATEHRVGWATVTTVQLYHHYDAAGLTACGYKRRKGELSFSEKPGELPAWQCCQACDALFVRDVCAEVAAPPAAVPTEQPAESERLSVAATVQEIPLDDIDTSRNYRQVFDEADLAELAESITAHSVMQPVLVRPTPAGQASQPYQLVYGGRRYKASALAGMATIPATVRPIADRDFLEIQLLENLQRVDVRPADEAHAFAELLKNGFPVEEIAAKVGKPARFVAERARLMELLPEWVEALQQGRLLIGSAQQLARLTRTQQAETYKLLQRTWGELLEVGGVMRPVYGASEVRQQIDRLYKPNDLDSAAFPKDDATLYPAAGACVACPRRTGNTLYLFDDLGGNQCLDGQCFATKVARHVERQLNELGRDGQPVLKVADHWSRVPADTLNQNKWQSPEQFTGEKLTQLREEGRVRTALMTEGTRAGHVVEIVLPAEVAQQPDVVAALKQQRQAETEKEKQEAAKVRALGAARRQAYHQLSTDLHGPGDHTAVVLRRMLYRALEYNRPTHVREMLQRVYGWGELSNKSYLADTDRPQILAHLAAMQTPQLYALLVDLELVGWLHEEHPHHIPALCKELGWKDEQLLAAHAEKKKKGAKQ
jgi:ParB/RepB/Spo0J family partition protein